MSVEVNLDRSFERLIGETLANRYRIESRIGEGAMGAVYRARHVKVGRTFAVKVLHPRLLADGKTAQRFEREAELAGRLRHPNLIGVVDVGETADGLRYMVMDFAEGPDLAALLAEAPMPPERVIRLVRQLLEGLYHAHEAGLIHRDFKPENVIVEKDMHGNEVPRIVDFGIAILREGGDSTDGPGRLTTNGLVLGTPHYMAPEQAVADPIDHRIDLFALGIMVYELLCGKLPFDGTGAEVARANLLLDPPAISQRVPYLSVDPLLEAFARKLMAKKRDARPATAKAARELLDLVEKDRDAAARALGVPPALAREPATTAPSQPVRHGAGAGDETFPPPLRDADTVNQAPAMSSPTAVPARPEPPRPETAHRTTDMRPPKRRRAIVVAGIVGLATLAAGGALLLGGAHEDTPTPATTQVVERAPSHESAKVEPIAAPVVEPTPRDAEPSGEVEVDTITRTDTVANPSDAKPSTPATVKSPVKSVRDKSVAAPRVETGSGQPRPLPARPVETEPVGTRPNVTASAEAKAAAKPVDAGALAAQYKIVGAQLKALQEHKGPDAVGDLWSRYRFIRLSDAMSTQEKRDAAAAILSKLATEATLRKQ